MYIIYEKSSGKILGKGSNSTTHFLEKMPKTQAYLQLTTDKDVTNSYIKNKQIVPKKRFDIKYPDTTVPLVLNSNLIITDIPKDTLISLNYHHIGKCTSGILNMHLDHKQKFILTFEKFPYQVLELPYNVN